MGVNIFVEDTVQLDSIYNSAAVADVPLRSLLYGTAMNSVLG